MIAAGKKERAAAVKRGGMSGFVERAKPRPAAAPIPAAKKRSAASGKVGPAGPTAGEAGRPRGRPKLYDERQALIARLTPEQYRRVRQLALDAGTTAQDLVIAGLSREFVERGLEPL